MSDNPSSSWDDLLRELGAAPPPEAVERRRPAIETTYESPKAYAAPPPKAKGGDWGSLAKSLGVDAPEPEPPRPARTAEPERPAPAARSEQPAEREGERTRDRSERSERGERGERRDRGGRGRSDRSRGPAGSDADERSGRGGRSERGERSDRGGRRSESPPRGPAEPTPGDLESSFAGIAPVESGFQEFLDEELDEEIEDIEFTEIGASDDAEGEDGDDEFDIDGLTGDAARSAFESLFQPGGPPTTLFGDTPRGRRGDSRRRTPVRDDVEGPPDQDEPAARAEDDDEGEAPRRGRRRRRGRGRGRRGEGTASSERPAQGERRPQPAGAARDSWDEDLVDELTDDDQFDAITGEPLASSEEAEEEDRPKRGRRRGRRRGRGDKDRPAKAASPASRSRDDDEDDDDDHDLGYADPDLAGEEPEGDDSVRGGSHKSIPSWSDAVGVVVEANLVSRKNSPLRPGSPRGRGRGRGGSGGGRRRRS